MNENEPNEQEVICPGCTHQFRAIPVQVQKLMLDAGFEPPFMRPPTRVVTQADAIQTEVQQFTPQAVAMAGNILSAACYGASRKSGWWQDVKTGQDFVEVVRSRGRFGIALIAEKLALVHSEVSEALEGARTDKMDNHLTHRKSIEVELADAVIRIGDLAGALGLDLGGAIMEKMEFNESRADHKIENRAAEGGKAF